MHDLSIKSVTPGLENKHANLWATSVSNTDNKVRGTRVNEHEIDE